MALSSVALSASAVVRFALGSAEINANYTASGSYSGGATTSGSADIAYVRQHSITSGSPLSLDLSGSLTQLDGSSAVFVRVKSILIKHVSGAGHLTIGGGSNALAGVTGFAGPNGHFSLSHNAGITVTAGSADILQIAASSGTVVCDVVIIGTSA